MNSAILLQIQNGGLSATQRAVRDRLQDGGSLTATLLLVTALIVILLVTFYLTARQFRARATRLPSDPRRLFDDLVNRLGFTAPEREMLESLTLDLQLEHPAATLLSGTLFDRHLARWRNGIRTAKMAEPENVVLQVRARLFPSA